MRKKWGKVVSLLVLCSLISSSTFVVSAEQPIENEFVEQKISEEEMTASDQEDENSDVLKDEADSGQSSTDVNEEQNQRLEEIENTPDNRSNIAIPESASSLQQETDHGTKVSGNVLPVVSYTAHVSEIGWQTEMTEGDVAGTVGQNLSMEAISINLDWEDPAADSSAVQYEVHVSENGWQDPVTNGGLAGTVGQAKAIEAIKISLTGPVAEKYDIYYRVHSAEYGWFDWAKNGELAGSVGFAYAMQAIEIRLYEKDSPDKPVTTGKTYLAEDNMGAVIYQVHMQDLGWSGKKVDGQEAGSSTSDKNLEAVKIQISESARQYGKLEGSVQYTVHVRDIGWQETVQDGQQAGTTGANKPVEAIKVNLTGQLATVYDIYYRVYSKNHGWFGWTKNGQLAGSVGFAYAVQAIEVQLYPKDSSDAPVDVGDSYLTEENMGKITYSAHVQEKGWQRKVADGQDAGTTGQGLGIEALTVNVTELGRDRIPLTGSVIYQAHVSGVGWQDEVADGAIAGTTGENRRIEAVKIRLTGQLEEKYDVYYRVHASNFGWLSWTKNGETAGSTGYGSAIEAIQIQLFEKGSSSAPSETGRPSLSREQISSIDVQEHIEVNGWQPTKNGISLTAGTTGENKSIEAIAMAVKPTDATYQGGISYNAHVSGIGWQGWTSDGNVAGTTGQGKSVEAIQIKLTGEMEKYCDIYYRAHVTNFGWLDWAVNGEAAGTSGFAYKLQAVEIKIVPKYTPSPGNTQTPFKQAPPAPVLGMWTRANLYSSTTPYIILVDRSAHKVGVFQGWQGNWSNIAFWDCSDGAPSTPTVEGVFRVGIKGYYFDSGNARCYWYTQFYGDYLFHSVLYNKYTGALSDGRLGMALSHGCVRLDINNAKWIYDNIPPGSTVVVYH
ncbi:L,D-transpeptidase family protein [Faecalicatena contorta]|uniref:L,D-transpeptidase family protein n=1 Tax=Faecalicatena contorta TaxID=39482 RepID=UPI0019605A01|nr:L,D-transpeptidase family protein [Faecalicatena contorta]MBM6685030.1 L,D-transpeptidase family protein [Faecalicatena contorta]MBM6710558.1 L,D-transpeptidase family protein [Faecalicatena contorta]